MKSKCKSEKSKKRQNNVVSKENQKKAIKLV